MIFRINSFWVSRLNGRFVFCFGSRDGSSSRSFIQFACASRTWDDIIFEGWIWSSANLVLADVGKMILGIIFTKVKLGSIIIPDLLRMCFSVFSLQTNDWKAWYVDFLTRVVVYWGEKMNVCIKSISDNYCWSAGRSSSIYFRRQITTSDLWSMGWFCSWSIFKPCSFHWTKRHAFSMHWNRSEQTAWQETYTFLSLENK